MQPLRIEKAGTIRVWGEWFGRPYDNLCTVTSAHMDEISNQLVIQFDGGIQATVFAPKNIRATSLEFSIEDAAKIEWDWGEEYRKRHPQKPTPHRVDENHGGHITTTEDYATTQRPANAYPALEIV